MNVTRNATSFLTFSAAIAFILLILSSSLPAMLNQVHLLNDPSGPVGCLRTMPHIFVETLENGCEVVIKDIERTQDGGFVATGYTGVGAGGKYVLLAKFDASGNYVWKRPIMVLTKDNSEGCDVVETHDGDFIVVGFTEYEDTGRDWLILKYDSIGDFQWSRVWSGDGTDEAHGIIETTGHNLWIVGFSNSFTTWPFVHYEAVLAKLSQDGRTLDGVRFGNPLASRDFYGLALAEVFDTDGICITGYVTGPLFGHDILLAKCDHTPTLRWTYRLGDEDDAKEEKGRALIRTSDACLAIAGEIEWWDGIYMNYGGFLLKTDSDAVFDWGRSASGGPHYTTTVQSVVETGDGGLVVTGGYDHQVTEYNALLCKWDLEGVPHWARGFGCDDFSDPVGYSVIEDSDRSLIVGGTTDKNSDGSALLSRCCATGQNCLDTCDGPDFGTWTPYQNRMYPNEESFTATLDDNGNAHFVTEIDRVIACSPATYTVYPDGSGDFEYIQDAIDFACNGDIIELCDTTFTGERNRGLDFKGKCLAVRSRDGHSVRSEINCEKHARGFTFQSGEGCHSIIESIRIINGDVSDSEQNGGGIYCSGASPVIQACVIEDCIAEYGGAVGCESFSYPAVIGCELVHNTAFENGGGIYSYESSPVMSNCCILDNFSYDGSAGGIYCSWGSISATNCLIARNGSAGLVNELCHDFPSIITNSTIVDNESYGIVFWNSNNTSIVKNCIVWGNNYGSTQIIDYNSDFEVVYSCVQGGWPGEGNFGDDPRFFPRPIRLFGYEFEYLLKPVSPCIDTGDPSIEDRLYDWHSKWPEWYPNGVRSDMGAYGGSGNSCWIVFVR
jgi:hypothetical protein